MQNYHQILLQWARKATGRRETALYTAFIATLVFRFAYVFITSPMHELFSDPNRHWLNGKRFFTPDLFGSIDPIMYQAWVWMMQQITRENPWGIALCVGLLSAIMPWLWYKALDEIVPRAWALAGGIAIALMPSLIMIYSYFMNETLVLALSGAAVWLSLRSLRLGTLASYAWAALFWMLSCYTRTTALPMAVVFLGILCLAKPKQIVWRGVLAAGLFGLMAIPACWHSEYQLNVCAPFGYPMHTAIHTAAQTDAIGFDVVGKGHFQFGQCSIHNETFAPFSHWKPPAKGIFNFKIDTAHGRTDWETALQNAQAYPDKMYTPLQIAAINVLRLFMDPSWPDNNQSFWMGWLAVQSRWIWLPLTIMICVMTWQYRRTMPWKRLLLPLLALFMLVLMGAQQRYNIEGRNRKPIEPLLLASCVILLYERQQRKRMHETQA